MHTFIGIDISAKTVDVVVRKNNKNTQVKQFNQDKNGRASLIKYIQQHQATFVVMEATGIYYLDLAIALNDANIHVSVINPKSFNHFTKIKLEDSKTDSIDAALLAEYAQRMTPKPWVAPDKNKLKLRDISRQLNRLTSDCTKAKNRLHALKSYEDSCELVISDEQDGIDFLASRIVRLREAALTMMKADKIIVQHFENILVAKGFAEVSIIAILGELMIIPETLKSNQVSRFAGVDVKLNQSGTSLNTPGRLSKAGNMYLRSALFMPAMSAVRHDPNVKAFYQSLVARGKKKIQAICAVMRKLLTGIWACIKSKTPFDTSKLFSEEHKKACV